MSIETIVLSLFASWMFTIAGVCIYILLYPKDTPKKKKKMCPERVFLHNTMFDCKGLGCIWVIFVQAEFYNTFPKFAFNSIVEQEMGGLVPVHVSDNMHNTISIVFKSGVRKDFNFGGVNFE